MSYQPHGAGVYATVNGVTYPARYHSVVRTVAISLAGRENPDFGVFAWDETRSLWCAELAAVDCTAVFEVSPRARHLGRACHVDGLYPDGSAEIVYADQDNDDRHTVPVSELDDYHEEHHDLSGPDEDAEETG